MAIQDIRRIAARLGVRPSELELHGRYKAKVNLSLLDRIKSRRGAYILVSAITPTPLGEGKTVTTIGLSMALNRLRRRAVCTLRQASLGPLFGAKGTGTGGGASQILPAEDVNLHFTGDTHAVGAANNLLMTFLENEIFHGNKLGIAPESILLKRCLDISDRSLRRIRYTLKSGEARLDMAGSFEITAASEVMSLLTLSRDVADMRRRLKSLVVAQDRQGRFITAADLKADGMMAAVLKEAIKPNLVQTSENTPCLIHTGPFANVSVGASSIVADRMALGLSDDVVTESGFGADCGAEKFFDIKCRVSGFSPDVCVLVCSARGLKAQSARVRVVPGEKIPDEIFREDHAALEEGSLNLKKQIENIRLFGVPVVVAVNVFPTDTPAEIDRVCQMALSYGAARCATTTAWKDGSRGALTLAREVVKVVVKKQARFRPLYGDGLPLKDKISAIATKVYGAGRVEFSAEADRALETYTQAGFGHLPVCIAKTQFSLSADETLKGAPAGFSFPVKDARLAAGAGFVLAHASLMQTMPGLPAQPRGALVDIDEQGRVKGLG